MHDSLYKLLQDVKLRFQLGGRFSCKLFNTNKLLRTVPEERFESGFV